MMRKLISVVWVIAAVCTALQTVAAPKNFIIILADDQGYGDLSCFGSKRIQSPNIDRLASEGMRMTQFYMASSVCSPSRAGMLTGRMPKRVGVPRVLFPHSTTGLPPEEVTIAEILKTKDYATALVGKWHLGHQKQFLPTNQGFDSYFGIPYSNNMSTSPDLAVAKNVKFAQGWTADKLKQDLAAIKADSKSRNNLAPLMRGNEVIEYPVDQSQLTKRYTEEAVRFIHENKDRSFFLYLAHAMPHVPIFASDAFKGSGENPFCDSIHEIDWSVGEVMKALKDTGLDQDTFVIYTSDNGPASAGSAGPLRGRKFMTFEGGVRVPTVIWSPGEVPAGVVCDEMVSALDLLPTIAGYVGAKIPVDRVYDGQDVADLLAGKTGTSPRNVNYYYQATQPDIDGIRVGDWKFLHKGGRNRKGQKPRTFEPMLFNLKEDPREKNNLYKSNPEKVEELKKKMNEFDASIK
ncbi:sulfatase family protein [Pontiella sulfatireligans]|uniref:Arylsulfatase n=1 Tax=Pontiella sulfatireligans TaxID=2750658 RepID=A0A6C2UT65_9BACT|nr:sulfatase [Pontiella sulfatireligans]SPS74511.1 sulfatase S1_14 [Kiritimatiellales bacterium]VGO22451.1 Arylsulfatase [Pontiella sulfatireligans]